MNVQYNKVSIHLFIPSLKFLVIVTQFQVQDPNQQVVHFGEIIQCFELFDTKLSEVDVPHQK